MGVIAIKNNSLSHLAGLLLMLIIIVNVNRCFAVDTTIVISEPAVGDVVKAEKKKFSIVAFEYVEELDWQNIAHVKFTTSMMESLGYQVDYVFLPGLRGVAQVGSAKNDAMLARTLVASKGFEGIVVPRRSYGQVCYKLFRLKTSGDLWEPRRIAYQAGAVGFKRLIKKTWPDTVSFSFSSFTQAVRLLKSSRVDGILVPHIAKSFIKNLNITELEMVPGSFMVIDLYFVLSEKHKHLLPAIEEFTEKTKGEFPDLMCGGRRGS